MIPVFAVTTLVINVAMNKLKQKWKKYAVNMEILGAKSVEIGRLNDLNQQQRMRGNVTTVYK